MVKSILLANLIVVLVSCTITTTKQKLPIFVDQKKTEAELLGLVGSKHLNLDGREITKGRKVFSKLEVTITNEGDQPYGNSSDTMLFRTIAVTIKENLRDKNEFDIYEVLFVATIKHNSVTERSTTGRSFNSTDLR